MATHIKGLEALDPKGNPKTHTKKHTPAEDKDAFKSLLDQKKAHLKGDGKDHKAKDKKGEHAKSDVPKDLPHIAPNSPLAHLLDKKLTPKQEKELKKELKAQAKAEAKAEHSKNKLDPFSQAMALKGAKNAKAPSATPTAKLGDIKNLESAKALNLSKLQHESKTGKLDKAPPKGIELATKSAPNLAKGAQSTQATQAQAPQEARAKISTADLLSLKNPKAQKAPLAHTTESKEGKEQAKSAPTNPKDAATNTAKAQTPLNQLLNKPKPMPHVKDSHDNDKEIKKAFQEAFDGPLKPKPTFIPLSFDPNRMPLQGPAKPLVASKDEDTRTSAIESPTHTAHTTHTTQKSTVEAPQIKETIKNLATNLRQELLDFKPPITKLSMELNPDKLGKVEVVIQQVGQNLQVSLASAAPVSALLVAHQSELRQHLSQMGFSNVDLRFNATNNENTAYQGGGNHNFNQQQHNPQQQGQQQPQHSPQVQSAPLQNQPSQTPAQGTSPQTAPTSIAKASYASNPSGLPDYA
ncbi:flagellar hook-length control protein FliK [Helicobacter ailurogastricus]|uniref:flagellar hook-length control protein FliK n=1 Tax=Helicobacter ailurogastricus TaxID=1578720 RepID=UPI0022BED320|nr:flagellar hook-length control protein FliK [Helicobacter ailurogastricus]GLH57866.1 hypothetical protein NHP214376_06540 [Helicobacter ailurogastricus]GLH59377.1 hypothetical protein NHP214377_06440 [Helicobacter ailurogastricus]